MVRFIRPQPIIKEGLACYIAIRNVNKLTTINFTLRYTKYNPSNSICANPVTILWNKTANAIEPGVSFLYKHKLSKGFYLIEVNSTDNQDNPISESAIYGTDESRLIIGYPYSVYSPIELSM